MSQVAFGRPLSRSVLGMLNDYRQQLKWLLPAYPNWSHLDLSLKLSETPCSPLQYQSPDCVTRALLAGRTPPRI